MSTYDELGRLAAFPADQVVQAALMIRTGTVVSLADHPRSGTTALHPFTARRQQARLEPSTLQVLQCT